MGTWVSGPKEDSSVRRCRIGIPGVPNPTSQKSSEDWCNHTLTRLLAVVVISRAHQKFVHCCRVIAGELLSTAATSAKVLKCWWKSRTSKPQFLEGRPLKRGIFSCCFATAPTFDAEEGEVAMSPSLMAVRWADPPELVQRQRGRVSYTYLPRDWAVSVVGAPDWKASASHPL